MVFSSSCCASVPASVGHLKPAVENVPIAGYTRFSMPVNLDQRALSPTCFQAPVLGRARLVDRRSGSQLHLFPLPGNDPLSDLPSSLAFLMHRIRVIQLLQAGGTLGSVGILKAAM